MNKTTTLIIFLISSVLFSQSITPKREFRATWVATVINLDWPSAPGLSSEKQKQELVDLFDKIEATNINAVIFQIRSECDAMYASSYDPWSYWLTGSQGTPPSPYYDPLEFAVEEAHKRGLELHAWFNPYRAERQVNNYITANNHVTNLHPDWLIRKGNIKFLNPGLPQVREYVTNVIMDVVSRYKVDGVHFDDYFYPYPPDEIDNEDFQTFVDYSRGFVSIDDWRRDNVNELLRMIHDSIQVVRPEVKFGMSPFGIYKNGVPAGISGLDAYSSIYCDPVAWLQEKIIDYLTPQLYWQFGGGQDYGKLLPWWASQVGERHLYPGQALYRAGSFPIGEIPRQIRLNRATTNTYGSVFFRAQNLFENLNGTTDSLLNTYYKYKSLIPQMSWKDQIIPNEPSNLRFETLANIRGNGIVWDKPSTASDGDSASMYVIYQLANLTPTADDLENPANIWKISSENYTTLNSSDRSTSKMYFAAASLDDNYNESGISNVIEVEVTKPAVPMLLAPVDNAPNQRDTTILVWDNSNGSSFNRLQVASSTDFDSIVYQANGIIDTFKFVTGLDGLTQYYWRVSALNIAGESEFSEIRNFTTGFPIPPLLNMPEDKTTDVELEPTLVWNASSVANEYELQIAEGLSIEPSITILDTLIADTTISLSSLNPEKIYSWHVRGKNDFGFSKWSEVFKFKTVLISSIDFESGIPITFSLAQNYPNPFNPETRIDFSINQSDLTTLKVYDLLGREVSVLKNEFMNRGSYSLTFNASKLSSGVYFYVLKSGNNIERRKMMLIK
ncbi:MAG: family 10 glycosylhydrolase [Ignavibacteriales bacterium]|nr:family 10 glycosylhydrolase [Ignavibacteriales bacterium]